MLKIGIHARSLYMPKGNYTIGIEMTKRRESLLKTIEKAGDAVIADDIKLLKKLAKH
jgi:hypothetical protein